MALGWVERVLLLRRWGWFEEKRGHEWLVGGKEQAGGRFHKAVGRLCPQRAPQQSLKGSPRRPPCSSHPREWVFAVRLL